MKPERRCPMCGDSRTEYHLPLSGGAVVRLCSKCFLPVSLWPRVGAGMECARWIDRWLGPSQRNNVKSLFGNQKRLARRALRGGKR